MSDPHLFIYGSLAPGAPNEHVLRPLGGTWQRATVTGRLDKQGWGARMGFPGFRPHGTDTIDGWLLTSEKLQDSWAELDEFEGAEYRRIDVECRLDSGTCVRTWIYALADDQ